LDFTQPSPASYAIGSFEMTWRDSFRTMAVAALGSAALFLAPQVHAEGNIIPPDEAAALARAQAEEVKAAAVAPNGEEITEAIQAKEPSKGAKSADKKAKTAEAAALKETKEASAEAAASLSVELPARPLSRSARADALKASALKPMIVRYASENGLPYELADAVVRLESRYNPGARNGPNVGLTQINVRTAQSLGYKGDVAGLFDAETNLRYGLKYLAQAYRLAGGDTCGTILRYQFGHRTTSMTKASQAYCAKVKVITAAAD
jgi:soluble lytic murein transglycosylase-like protein